MTSNDEIYSSYPTNIKSNSIRGYGGIYGSEYFSLFYEHGYDVYGDEGFQFGESVLNAGENGYNGNVPALYGYSFGYSFLASSWGGGGEFRSQRSHAIHL